MTNPEIKNKIENLFEGINISNEEGEFLTIEISKEILKDFMLKIRDEQDLDFDYLFALTGVDFGKELGVVYHIESTKHRHLIQVTVKTDDRENAEIDTIHDIFPAAYYNEMEAHELLGIKFKGHPDLKHLFLPEDWDKGYPLRKDFTDINMLIR